MLRTVQPIIGSDGSGSVATEDSLADAVNELESIDDRLADETPVRVYGEATNTNGTSFKYILTTASVNTTAVSTTASGIYNIWAFNTTETEAFIRFYNDDTPDCTSATGFVFSMGIPPSPAAGQQGGFAVNFPVPLTGPFTTAIGVCVTGGHTSTDNTAAPAAILIGIAYKGT